MQQSVARGSARRWNLRRVSLPVCSRGTMVGSSPRFDMYGCDFGWGRPVATRSGRANKFASKKSLYPGREGGGNIVMGLTLTPENMAALEEDEEFWAAVTPEA